MTARHRVFARMWGVAIVTHLAGNWRYSDIWPDLTVTGLVLGVIGLLATAVVVVPRRGLLLALSALVPVGVALELPDLSNHWLLAGFVSAAYFVTLGRWERFEPVARLILLFAYGFAAFAKLNTGFLDPVTSCALYYVNEIVGELGGTPIAPSGPLGFGTAWLTAALELSVPT
ncbi:MAG TPA: hypothetical protein VJ938_00705, partial [Acidimicrobiia bacterium]|nr:hypothetical protein [Acidimicrobiia bacterium]